MRTFLAAVAVAVLAGCSSSNNPYDTSAMNDRLDEHERRSAELELAVTDQGLKRQEHDEKVLAHELSDWRASALQQASRDSLQVMKEQSTARVTSLEAQEKEFAALAPSLSADQLVDIRWRLRIERQKVTEIDGQLNR